MSDDALDHRDLRGSVRYQREEALVEPAGERWDAVAAEPGSRDVSRTERARSFGRVAADYDRSRPPYPRAGIDWLVGVRPCRVVDLGAGTGKLTAAVVDAGHDVLAVEPDHTMLAQLAVAVPRAGRLQGAAEAIPLAGGSVDAVVAGQAWHWFEHPRAVVEIARVLRPGGTVGIVWNVRDDTQDWMARWGELAGSDDGTSHVAHEMGNALGSDLGDRFGPIDAAQFPHTQVMAVADLVTLAASRSGVVVLPEDERRDLLDAVMALTRTHPDLAGREQIAVPYVTYGFRSRPV